MNHHTLVLAVAGVLAAANASAGARPLAADALDSVVAGGEIAAANESDNTHTSAVVADDARFESHIRRAVELTDAAQSGVAALNVVNGSQADVANAANVLDARDTSRSVNQANGIEQSEQRGARAGTIERNGVNRTSVSEESASFSSQQSFHSYDSQRMQTRTHSATLDTFNAEVPGYFPLQSLRLDFELPQLPSVTVPAFSFDLVTTDDAGGQYGIRGGLGPFYFDPPQFSLGSIELAGNDLILRGGYVDLPSLDLGTATIDFCVVKCGGVSVDLPTIDGPRIDFGGEYRLVGGNPFKDVRVNAGGGVSVAGRGHLSMDLGRVTVGASLSIDLPDLTTNFSFDVLGYKVNTGNFGVTIPPISASIDLIDADFGAAYEADFNGVLCLSVVTISCDGLTHRETREDSRVDVVVATASSSQSHSSRYSAHGSEQITMGARMTAAEADLIAMSASSALIDTESLVQLDAQAQRGMRAFNAVNATGAMVGNSLNVGAQRSTGAASGALSQSNVFNQYQTRPRGR